MKYIFNQTLFAYFIKREKRFFSYFRKENGELLVAHCVNTGKMMDLLVSNSLCLLSNKNTGKLMYTWEGIKINDQWIGTNTSIPNKLVEQLIKTDLINGLKNEKFKQEVTFKFTEKTYRADFASDNTIIEVKNVHWVKDNMAYFPDCVTERGANQMNILIKLKEMGKRVIVIYILQRNDIEKLSINQEIDSVYYEKVEKAKNINVEFYGFNCNLHKDFIAINKKIQFIF